MNIVKKIVSQLSYTLFANFAKLATVGVLTLIIPKLIDQNNYGYWQLYVFYSSYVGFLHFGWCDGIYLREGGKKYNSLNKQNYKSQFVYLIISQIVLSLLLLVFLFAINTSLEKSVILFFVCINAIIATPSTFLAYLLQSTGEIKNYAISNVIGRISYFFITLLLIFLGYKDYLTLLIADISGLLITFFYLMFVCKDIIHASFQKVSITVKEIFLNIKIGSKLMLANIASSFIIGITRLMMEARWSIVEFAKISLSLNFCNLLLVFINAVSLIMYPILRRYDSDNLKYAYRTMDGILSLLLYFFLLFYFPIKLFIINWIPEYVDSIKYMAILFPICIFESRISLITNTFLKVLRKENIIFLVNIIVLLFSFILSYASAYIYSSIQLTILTIVIVLGIKCILSEFIVSNLIKIKRHKEILFELFISGIFIIMNWFIEGIIPIFIYVCIYALYFYQKKNDLTTFIQYLKG